MIVKKSFWGLSYLLTTIIFFTPFFASAHEVYVLSSSNIARAINTPSFNLLDVMVKNLHEFVLWAFIGIIVIFCVFFISTLRLLEKWLDPIFIKIRKYGPLVARITIGISFLACAYYQSTFGPELPLLSTFGNFSNIIVIVFWILGISTLLGLLIRPMALIALVIFAFTAWYHGIYMLTYVNYLGEIIVLIVLNSHILSLDSYIAKNLIKTEKIGQKNTKWIKQIKEYLSTRSFAILRILFGTALIYASIYAKVIHNNLALFTIEQYHLDKILGFESHFLVLGTAIVELLIGVFFIFGIEIRFTALFFLFWLTLSLLFFGEIVWPHLILIGIPIAYIFYGYDKYSIEGYFFRKKKYEPIL